MRSCWKYRKRSIREDIRSKESYDGKEQKTDEFVKALLSESRSDIIPEEDVWYAPLIGD